VPVGSPSAVAAVRGDTAVRSDTSGSGAGAGGPAGTGAAGISTGHNETGEVVTLVTPRRFRSVGEWYADFGQLTDADVLALLSSGA
jgi:hypothetical protein